MTMKMLLIVAALGGMTIAPGVASAAPVKAAALGKTAAPYTVQDTELGAMLDDPVAKAILLKHAPDLASNPQIDMARPMTLVQLKQYAGDMLTDKVVADIQADLDKASPK